MTNPTAALRRTLKVAVAIIGTALAAGMTYQGVATALERRDFPPPGARISIGDHQLHLYCVGDGGPTVVLEAPEAGLSSVWGRVQPALASHVRVCAYDRAGLGWSEASGLDFDAGRVPEELHALLDQAAVRRPIVLAGLSLGAWYARLYAGRFPDDVSALVLADEPDAHATSADTLNLIRRLGRAPWMARVGMLRLAGQPARTDGLPTLARGATHAFLLRPDHLARAAREVSQWQHTADLVTAAPLPPSIRVVSFTTPGREAGAFPVRDIDELAFVRAVADARKSADR